MESQDDDCLGFLADGSSQVGEGNQGLDLGPGGEGSNGVDSLLS